MPIVALRGYTQFIQKITLARLLKVALGVGLMQAKDEVERLLDGDEIRVELGSMTEAQAFLRAVTAIGVSGVLLDDSGMPLPIGSIGEGQQTPFADGDEAGVIVGPTWVMWGEPAPEDRADPDDEAKARRVLLGCQGVVDDERASERATDATDGEESSEAARFTDWLRSYADPDTLADLAVGRVDVMMTPALTQFGMYLALSEQGQVFAALRCI